MDNIATVIGADKNITTADIVDTITWSNRKYPVTYIEDIAFMNCQSLSDVNLPNTITNIGASCFYNCYNLASIVIPPSVTHIHESAFCHCCNLSSIYFSPTPIWIGEGAFVGCYSLNSIHISDLESWCNSTFERGGTPFFPNYGNLYLNNVLVKALIIPEEIKELKSSVFERCGSIESIATSNSLEKIGLCVCYQCPNLRVVTLGCNTSYFEGFSFDECPKLEIVNIKASIPPTFQIWSGVDGYVNDFTNSYPEYMTLHVPKGTTEIYENAYGWKDFGAIIDDLDCETGVNPIYTDSINYSLPIEIFNLNGNCVFYGTGNYTLPCGIYLVRQGTKTHKIFVN